MTNQSSTHAPLLLCLGLGYTASILARRLVNAGWRVAGTTRTPDAKATDEVQAVLPQDAPALLPKADAVLISVPPGEGQSWALKLMQQADIRHLRWAGYLSSTGVYGDHHGCWVDESTPPAPFDARSHARLTAEQEWQNDCPAVQVFRLAGIYGPGRNALVSLKQGKARQIVKPGQFFSRIHVADIVSILQASLQQPQPGAIYNLADDEPAPSHEITRFAASLLNMPPPPEELYDDAEMTEMMRSFYRANRRVDNRKVKRELGIDLAYPTYREGLTALLEEE